MLYEDIEDLEILSVIARCYDVVAGQVVGSQLQVLNRGSEFVRLTRIIRPKVHRTGTATDADLHITKVFRSNSNL